MLRLFCIAGLILLAGCHPSLWPGVANVAYTVDVVPSAELVSMVGEGEALSVVVLIGEGGNGRVAGPVLTVCQTNGQHFVETAVYELHEDGDGNWENTYVVDKSPWQAISADDPGLREHRGRVNGTDPLCFPDPEAAAMVAVGTVACGEESIVDNDGVNEWAVGEAVARSVSVPLDTQCGPGPAHQVGTDGYAEPTVVDLSEGLTVIVND